MIIPSGGVIEDIEGVPTGILKERAVELVLAAMGKKSKEEMKGFISDGLNLCVQMGLTAVQTNDTEALSVYRELQNENKLPVRVFLTPNYEELLDIDENIEGNTECYKSVRPLCMAPTSAPVDSKSSGNLEFICTTVVDLSSSESRLIVERVKIFADGSLGAETAALRAQNAAVNIPTDSNTGIIVTEEKDLEGMIIMTIIIIKC